MVDGRHIVSIFGSSRPEQHEPEYQTARELGQRLSECGFVVCNGGYGGIMEASARGAKEAVHSPVPHEERTIGIVADAFGQKPANRWIDRTIRVESLVDRLQKLISMGDAYVVLKGGTGTLLEFAAVWEFMNKRMMPSKPIMLLGDFWDDVLKTLRGELEWEGLAECTRYVTPARTPDECARILRENVRTP